ncbi:Uncharacterized protein TCM_031923 [Theobroma cacao]|uniref:Uncharacterized protein n=1 Tax=Theobroma cacao TaxID=3641 RepID=A0A061F8Z9_THECC|nr:Uncharacterized protein TCM_031923 [Theobroma cacao]
MVKKEETTVRGDSATKAAATKNKTNHITCFRITLNPIPQVAICTHFPRDCLPLIFIARDGNIAINVKGVVELD